MVFPVESVRAPVEVYFRPHRPLGRAPPHVVGRDGGREVVDLPAGPAEAAAPVGVLPEEEEPLVQAPHALVGRPTHHEAGPGDPVHLERIVAHMAEAGQLPATHGVVREQTGEGRGTTEEPGPERRITAGRALDCPVGVQELGPHDRGVGALIHEGDEHGNRGRAQHDVGVQEQRELARGPHERLVDGTGESAVLRVLQDLDARMLPGGAELAPIGGGVVHQQDLQRPHWLAGEERREAGVQKPGPRSSSR